MPALATPAASSQTQANNQGGLTTVTVNPPRKVTYLFFGVSSANLKIPYAVAVNGSVLPDYAAKTRRVSCPKGGKGKFSVTVQQGQTVSLYLNSDAHPDFRQKPVYAVTAGDRDVEVRINELYGKHTEADTPVQQIDPDAKVEAEKTADTFSAMLTGDIWMKVSHRYTQAEAEARMPQGTSAAVREAVKRIYRGLVSATLTVTEPATTGKPAQTLQVAFADSDNPNNNISSYSLLGDGLPRVHPAGYAALFTAALSANVLSLTLSSCWRPLLGSIAHRAGLGLDVSVLGGTALNRLELRKKGDGDDSDNVTDAEVLAFKEYEVAIEAEKEAQKTLTASKNELAAAKKEGDKGVIKAAEGQLNTAEDAAQKATESKDAARTTWGEERDTGENAHTQLFRAFLLGSVSVKQLFDPWFMDSNTRDQQAASANEQRTTNEKLHAHHLHITVNEPRIL